MWPSTNIEYERLLKPWDEEMSTFADGIIDDSSKSVEEDSALTTVDGVEGGVQNGGADAETEGGACNVREEGYCCLAATHFFAFTGSFGVLEIEKM